MVTIKNKEASLFSVKAACKRLGIGPHTLRAWETRYGAVDPHRSESGQRQYSAEELDRLAKIVHLVNLGHSVGTVAKLTDGELGKLLRRPSEASKGDAHAEVATLLEELEASIRRFDINRVSSLLEQKRIALGARTFVLEILGQVLSWMGQRVAADELSIAHEHALSAIVRDQIYQSLRYGAVNVANPNTPHVVLATPEDDLHEFGILMAATLFSHYGVPSHLLGANLPAEALALAAKAVKADVVLLGNAPVPDSERRVSFTQYLTELHAKLPKDTAVWIGGAGQIPHLRAVMPGRETLSLSSFGELDVLIARWGKG